MVDDRQELLAKEFDALVLQGKMIASAVDDQVKLHRLRVVVSDGKILLDDLPLSEAVAKIVSERDYLKPVAAIDPAQESLRADQALAVAGNLSAQGRVRKSFGKLDDKQASAAFDVWCKSQGVRLGKVAEKTDADGVIDKQSTNPWKNGNRAEQIRLLSTLPTAACVSLAKSAGMTITGSPLRRWSK